MTTNVLKSIAAEAAQAFSPVYCSQIQEVARGLRPRFESGELRGITDHDLERQRFDPNWVTPFNRIVVACAEGLGLATSDTRGCRCLAGLLLAVSPSGEIAAAAPVGGDHLVVQFASIAAAFDVIVIARGCGWYSPASDELPLKDFSDGNVDWFTT